EEQIGMSATRQEEVSHAHAAAVDGAEGRLEDPLRFGHRLLEELVERALQGGAALLERLHVGPPALPQAGGRELQLARARLGAARVVLAAVEDRQRNADREQVGARLVAGNRQIVMGVPEAQAGIR